MLSSVSVINKKILVNAEKCSKIFRLQYSILRSFRVVVRNQKLGEKCISNCSTVTHCKIRPILKVKNELAKSAPAVR